jgi:HSP20 family protein
MSPSLRQREDIQTRLNRLCGSSLLLQVSARDAALGYGGPPADAQETAQDYLIKIYCPDLAPSDVEVKLQDGVLTVEGERRQPNTRLRDGTMAPAVLGHFVRRFTLPLTVETANVHAELADGVLSIQLPKLPKSQTAPIQVKVAQGSRS